MPRPTAVSSRNANFDYLRLLLASAVVLSAHLPIFYKGSPHYNWVFPVPDFIALSGFLVTESFRKSNGYLHFFWKRLLRVGPAFGAAVLVATLLFGLHGFTGSILQWASAGFAAQTQNPNASLWSLSVEEVLYLALAGLFALGAFRLRWPVYALFVICLLGALAPFFRHNESWSALAPVPAAFLVGALLTLQQEKLAKVPEWAATCLLIFSFLPLHGIPLVVVSTLQGLACVVFALRGPRIRLGIPDISYGLYVYHWPILMAAAGHVNKLAAVALVYALALASWYLLEKPALFLKDRFVGRVEPKNTPKAVQLEPGVS